ncbi:MAG: glycosyltransferase, partial [Paraglaciecola sp.]|nr:glycosyltransferase [Paraglaciecola sp.]
AVVSNIYGLTDAVVKNETGLFFEPGDIQGLAKCLVNITTNQELLLNLSRNAKKRVVDDFSDQHVSALLSEYIVKILN